MSRLITAYREAFRNWVRSKTGPYSIEEAEEKKFFWSRLYAIVSCSIFGYCIISGFKNNLYATDSGGLPKNIAAGANIAVGETINFISIKGTTKVEDFTYSKEEMEELRKTKKLPDSKNSTAKT